MNPVFAKKKLFLSAAVCQRSYDPFYRVTYSIKRVKSSWSYINGMDPYLYLGERQVPFSPFEAEHGSFGKLTMLNKPITKH